MKKMQNIFRFGVLLFLLINYGESFDLRVMKVLMSNDPSSGMDGGMFGQRWFGYGGDFEMMICSHGDDEKTCCSTGELNTSDNNWEKGEINYFIGHQLNKCQDFELSTSFSTTLKVQHHGSDGGKIERVELRGALRYRNRIICEVNQKLDNDDSITVNCTLKEEDVSIKSSNIDNMECMGKPEFCNIKINKFSFAGSHNSGTGMSGSIQPVECVFKNHDLTIQEQLDFGIRFFDTDIAYSHSLPGCNGLEAVHGKKGMYYCFGSIQHMFKQVIEWSNANPNEIVLLHFGSLYKGNKTFQPLIEEIKNSFSENNSSVKINKAFQKTGNWPTLGEAIAKNERIFIFVVETYDNSTITSSAEEVLDYIKVFKVDNQDAGLPSPILKSGWSSFSSTYGSGKIGSNCDEVVKTVNNLCQTLSADFIKVATYGTPWKSLGLVLKKSNICIETYARMCNPRMEEIVKKCKSTKPILNVILSDYPNHPSTSQKTLTDLVDEENLSHLLN